MTYWKLSSLDRRLSDRKVPSCSENVEESFQNCSSLSRAGTGVAVICLLGKTSRTLPVHAKVKQKIRMRERLNNHCDLMLPILPQPTALAFSDDLGWFFVDPQAEITWMPELAGRCPFGERNLCDELRQHPMNFVFR